MRRILVDLLGYTGARGGTETYARELLARLPQRMPGVSFMALVGGAGAPAVRGFFPGDVHVIPWVAADPMTWAAAEVVASNRAARRTRADLVWTPANFGPLLRGVPRVATIHDVIYHEVKGGNPRQRVFRAVTSWLMRRSARSADAVIAVSHATADKIRSRLGVASETIHVVPNGSAEPRPVTDPWGTLAPLGIATGRPLLLSTGNRMPHKNFAGLLHALASIAPVHRPLAVLPGAHSQDPLTTTISELGLSEDVVLPGWVSEAQLDALYAVADVYACPSLAEGFGLPVVDAMRRGVRVVANDIPVLREVGGEAARYADATDPTAFGAAIVAELTDTQTPEAGDRRRAHAARYTWDAAADGTAAVLERVLRERRRG